MKQVPVPLTLEATVSEGERVVLVVLDGRARRGNLQKEPQSDGTGSQLSKQTLSKALGKTIH